MKEEKKPFNINDIPRKDIFGTPDGYFDSLQKKIEARIDEQKEGKTVRMRPIFWNIGYAAAASVAVFILIWFTMLNDNKTPSAEDVLASVSSEDLVLYLQQEEVDIKDILEIAPELSTDESPIDLLAPDLGDDELEELYNEYDFAPENYTEQ